jgi:hypothetical protein
MINQRLAGHGVGHLAEWVEVPASVVSASSFRDRGNALAARVRSEVHRLTHGFLIHQLPSLERPVGSLWPVAFVFRVPSVGSLCARCVLGSRRIVGRVGLVNSARLRCLRILVDQPTQDRLPLNPGGVQVSDVR